MSYGKWLMVNGLVEKKAKLNHGCRICDDIQSYTRVLFVSVCVCNEPRSSTLNVERLLYV